MPGRKYSEAQIAAAVDRRAQGHGLSRIAADLDMTRGAVEYHCLAQGVSLGDGPVVFLNRTRVVRRGNHLVRLFTRAEDARAVSMRVDGATITEIARAIGRKPVSVRCRLQALARRDELSGVAA
jgi:transposase-like protein